MDHVRCLYPLPDGYNPNGKLFSTFDLDNEDGEFTITPLGRLVSDVWHYEALEGDEDISVDEHHMNKVIGSQKVIDEKNVDCEHHGEVEFRIIDEDGNARSYSAYFDEGRLTHIKGGIEMDFNSSGGG